jgi:hypothetical protein
MPKISCARLAKIERAFAADLGGHRKIGRLEKIGADKTEHPARRHRAYMAVWAIWRDAAMATPAKAKMFWERARQAALLADTVGPPKPSDIIAARLAALKAGEPTPAHSPDPDLKNDPDSPASVTLRERLNALAAAHRRDT